MCTQAQLQLILRAIYNKSTAKFGNRVASVILYGSYARGDYDEESDIDIMVLVNLDKEELSKHRWEMSGLTSELSLDYGVTISLHLQDCATFEKFKNDLPFYMNVIKEGIPFVA